MSKEGVSEWAKEKTVEARDAAILAVILFGILHLFKVIFKSLSGVES